MAHGQRYPLTPNATACCLAAYLHGRPVLRCARVVGIQVPPLCRQDAQGVERL